jgi:aldehyde dehydrogenase (NAD+)
MTIDVEEHRRLAEQLLVDAQLVIGDSRMSSASGGVHRHVNPTTGREQADVPLAGPSEIADAISSAREAFQIWRRWRPDERRDALLRLAALVLRDGPTIGTVLTLEAGVPSAVAGSLPRRAADYLSYYAGYADKLEGSVIPIFPENAFDYTTLEPLGVIGIISTWNGGISSIARKAGAALAVGNTVVVKPMELAPFSVIRFAELAIEAGIPPGVVNVVPGGADAGEALCGHPGVDKISFTGGLETARAILTVAARNITPVVLELGGKSGNIIFPDADLAAAGQFSGSVCMSMAGQGCVYPTRLIVHEDVHDEILERVVAVAAALPFGDPLASATVVGPVISEGHRDRIMGMIDRARSDASGQIVLGGERGGGELADGFFIRPTVIDGVASDAYIAQEEVFGPVLSVMTFGDEDEAIALANDTPYGLAGYVHTNDLRRAHRVAGALDAGYVSLNSFAALPASAPFGGFGLSGFGKEGGRQGLLEFVRTKNIYLGMG